MYIFAYIYVYLYFINILFTFLSTVSPRVLEGLMAWLVVVTGALVSMLLEKVRVTVMNLVLV